MARISTYVKDGNITSDDKLLGSNYGGLDNQGRPIFTTANFKIADLLVYFSQNIDVGGGATLGGLLSDVNKIKTLYTFDENGNYTGLSEAGVLLIANSEVADGFASASFQIKVFADVLSIDPETGAYVASSAFANTVMTAETTTDYASASILNEVQASIGTFDAEGRLVTLSEAFANQIMTAETTTDYAEASIVNTLSAAVGNIPRIYRQDEEPSVTESPIGSLWFDTDNNNKAYILVEGDPNVWTLTEDTEFKQFKATYENSIIASATNSSANVTKITNLNATLDILDTEGNSKYTNAEYKDTISTYVDENSATAQRTESMAAQLGFYDAGTDTYSFSSANLTDTVNALALTNYASTQRVNTIESKVGGKPDVYRQDEQPAIYAGDPSEQVIPEGSIWYDTDADNKVYVVAEDPENAGTFIWTLTDDSRIGATAEQITNITAEFGSFDANNNFTIDTSAGYFEAVKAYADDDSAAASKITNLGAEIGTFDENNNFSTSLSANFKQAVNNEVDQNSATAGYVNNLSAAVGIDKLDGTPQSQATALVNGATDATTTTATLDGIVSSSKQLVIAEANADIKVGQYVTYSEQSSTLNRDLVWRVEAIDGINIYLDNEISLEDTTTVTFTGTDVLVVDNVSGTIREGFQIKGEGITPGTYVSAVDGLNITMSRAEVVADDVALEFLGIYAAVTETANVVAKVDGSLESTYGLQVDANGNVAGMKLLANNEGSEISFLADSFKVYNGATAEAPFEIVDNQVKIKSAAIQQISFGDLSGIPDYFIVTTVYADDALGTNASTTRGSKNFYGIHQGQEAWEDGDSVAGITFNQITGDTGAQGPQGDPGDPGDPGVSAYFHVKYSNDNGATFTGNDGNDIGDYIGTYTDSNETPSTDTNDYTWIKIIGQDGIQGPTGDRVYTTNLFYQTIVTDGSTPTFDTTNLTYNFDTASFGGIPTGWATNPPSSSPGSGTNALFYVSVNVVEGDPNVITVGNPTTYFNFNGLVTFTGTTLTDGSANFDYTAIDGAWITTGAIKSSNFTFTNANGGDPIVFDQEEAVTQGAIFDLVNGYIKTPNFWLHSNGNAYFTGDISGSTGNFTGDISGSTGTFKGVVDILDTDNDVVVKVHDGEFIGAEPSGTSAAFPDVNEITITTWDASDTTVSTTNGVTKSSLFDDDDDFLYSDVKWVQFPAGTTTHTLVTDAITDPIATLSSDYYGFMRVNLGVEFGNSDFSTIYYSQVFPNVNYEADGEVLLPSYTQNISLTFTEATNVYVRFYLRRIWKLQVGSATFAQRTFSVDSDLAFIGIKGKTELSPNGLQVLNSESVYFKIDRKNFNSGNPYVDIGGDVLIDGNLEVTGNIEISGDVENSDVSVSNLEDRLGEISNNTYIGSSAGTATFTVRDNLIVDGNLTVNGETTTISATNLAVEDNMIYLNAGSTVANPDLGIAGNYNDGTYAHAGIFRDASDGKWKFYDGYTPEPDASTAINTGHASFNLATVNAGSFIVGDGTSGGFLKANGTIDTNTYLTSNDISAFITLADLTTEDVDVNSLEVGGTTVVDSSRNITGVSGNFSGDVTIDDKLTIKNPNANVGFTEIGTIQNNIGNGYTRASIILSRNADQITWDNVNSVWVHEGGDSSDWSAIMHTSTYGLLLFSGDGLSEETTYTSQEFRDTYLSLALTRDGHVSVNRGNLQIAGTTVINSDREFYVPQDGLHINGLAVTTTAAELNKLDGATVSTTELNKLDGFTGDSTDLNYAKDLYDTGVTASEFSALDDIEGNIQTQINNVDAFKYNSYNSINSTDGYVNLFEMKVPTGSPKGGSACMAFVRIRKILNNTNVLASALFNIVADDDGLVTVNVTNSKSKNVDYKIVQDAANPFNYQFQVKNKVSSDDAKVEVFIFDIAKKGEVGSGNVLTRDYSTYSSTKEHDILAFDGSKIVAFDTSVTGTNTVATNLSIEGTLTVDAINLTGLSSTGGRTTQTETVLISSSEGTYPGPIEIVTLPDPGVIQARSFLKFTVFGGGEFLEKKYVCDWNDSGNEWNIYAATEESSGKYDVQYDFTNDKFDLVIVDGSTTLTYNTVTVTVDHLGADIYYNWTYSL